MGFEGSSIDRLLSTAVESGALHGVVATVVDRDGVLYEGAAGFYAAHGFLRFLDSLRLVLPIRVAGRRAER